MAIDLAQLVVSMEANTAKFQKDMDRVNGKLDQFARNSRRTADTVSGALTGIRIGAMVGGLVAFTRAAANNVSQQKALAEGVGLSVSAFSALNYAARQSELSQEDLGKALFRLNTVMGDAAQGNDKAAATLARFGISVDDVRSGAVGSEQALRKIADTFNEMPNGINKSALAADLLGDKLGGKLIPFLNHGSVGLDEFASKGEAVGAVMNDKVADAVARANDKLSAFAQTLQTQVLVGLSALFGLVEANQGDKAIQELTDKIAGLNSQLAHLQKMESRAETGGILGALLHTGDAAKIAEIRLELAALNKERDKLKAEQLDRLSAPTASGTVPVPGAAPKAPGVGKTSQAAKDYARDLERARAEVLLLNDAEGEAAQMRALVNQLYAQGKIPQDAYLAFLEEAAQDLTILGEEAAQAEEQTNVFADQAARNVQSFTASLVDAAMAGENMADTIVAALRRIAAEMLTSMLLQSLGNSLSGSSNPFLANLGKGLAGARADGGPVSGGGAYLVGEEGPELFVPRASGNIVPNGSFGGRGKVEINVDARGADPTSTANMMRALADVERRIYENFQRGTGPVA